jgi:Mg-chelatase subunit ChlI
VRRLPRARRPRRRRHADRLADRDNRFVEKLATPDVTIADMVGDIDPIKAAQAG